MEQQTAVPKPSTAATLTRWTARLLSALVLLFWGFFIVSHLFSPQSEATHPLTDRDYTGLVSMGAWLAGLALAWKWELAGGVITLVAWFVGIVINPAVAWFLPIPVAAVLFLTSWWLRRQPDTVSS